MFLNIGYVGIFSTLFCTEVRAPIKMPRYREVISLDISVVAEFNYFINFYAFQSGTDPDHSSAG